MKGRTFAHFLNRSKEIAVKDHPDLAWAHEAHRRVIEFYEGALQTKTFCENTQERIWEKANQAARLILEGKPLPCALDNKEIHLEEIKALREDLNLYDQTFTPLAAQRYLFWSQLYLDHFPSKGLEDNPLETVDLLAEQGMILALPQIRPTDAQGYKLYLVSFCLEDLAWERPLYHVDEVPALIQKALSINPHEKGVLAQITHNQDKARLKLREALPSIEPSPLPEREICILKIKELQNLLISHD